MPRLRSIDDYVVDQMSRQRIPGLSVAVAHGGQLIVARGYGLANVEKAVSCSERTQFEIGSVTKPLTATAVMLLANHGKIGLDDPIASYLASLPAAWVHITLRHLLTHTSGIRPYTEGADLVQLFRSDCPPAEILGLVADLPLAFEPGARWAYSNTNYYLLGMLIEEVSGQSYWDCLARLILDPLGMADTGPSDQRTVRPDLARGYALRDGRLEPQEPITPTSAWAAGSLVSTAVDLTTWGMALTSNKLIDEQTRRQMWTPHRLEDGAETLYGLGWVVDRHRGTKHVWHNGGTAGFRAIFSHFPDQELSVIVLSNLAQAAPEGIAKGIAGLCDPALLPPSMMVPENDPEPEITEGMADFLTDYAEDNGRDRHRMAAGCIAANMPGWRRLTADRIRDMRSFTFIGSEVMAESGTEPKRYAYYKSETPRETRYYTFVFAPDGRIEDFSSDL